MPRANAYERSISAEQYASIAQFPRLVEKFRGKDAKDARELTLFFSEGAEEQLVGDVASSREQQRRTVKVQEERERKRLEFKHMLRGKDWDEVHETDNLSSVLQRTKHIHELGVKARKHVTPRVPKKNLKTWVPPTRGKGKGRRHVWMSGKDVPKEPKTPDRSKRLAGIESPRKGFSFRKPSAVALGSTKRNSSRRQKAAPIWVPNSASKAKGSIAVRYFLNSPDEEALRAERAYTAMRSKVNYRRFSEKLRELNSSAKRSRPVVTSP